MGYAPLELCGKVAVVVGGTSGIGRAIARGLAEAGADVVPTSRRAEQVESAAVEIEERGRRTLRLVSDVSDRASLKGLLDETVGAFGKVDILVNSAGRTMRAPTLDFNALAGNFGMTVTSSSLVAAPVVVPEPAYGIMLLSLWELGRRPGSRKHVHAS